jgi:hypothetical protein
MAADARRFALAPDVVLQAANGEALLVTLATEDMFALNATGAEIVHRLTTGLPLGAIIDELTRAYDAPANAVASDVAALVTTLESRGLIVHCGED